MYKAVILILTFLSACSRGPPADLQYIKQARSIAAEWALINNQAKADNLTSTYVVSMHQSLRENLQTAFDSLSDKHSSYGQQMNALLAERADAAPAELRARAEALKRIEDDLESA